MGQPLDRALCFLHETGTHLGCPRQWEAWARMKQVPPGGLQEFLKLLGCSNRKRGYSRPVAHLGKWREERFIYEGKPKKKSPGIYL